MYVFTDIVDLIRLVIFHLESRVNYALYSHLWYVFHVYVESRGNFIEHGCCMFRVSIVSSESD